MLFLYIDPGAGSLVIQAVLAAALAVPFFLRSQVARVLGGLRSLGRRGDDSGNADR
jgi:hypothetical protein